jgi:hypothetical protein
MDANSGCTVAEPRLANLSAAPARYFGPGATTLPDCSGVRQKSLKQLIYPSDDF